MGCALVKPSPQSVTKPSPNHSLETPLPNILEHAALGSGAAECVHGDAISSSLQPSANDCGDLCFEYKYEEHAHNRRRRRARELAASAGASSCEFFSSAQRGEPEIYPELTPQKIAQHYGFPQGGTGSGQKVAVIAMDGKLDMDELKRDFERIGIQDMPDVRVVDVGHISADQDAESSVETHLDVEVIGAICPKATITVYRAPNSLAGFASAIQRAVDDRNNVISISWGLPESQDLVYWGKQMDDALGNAKVAGITVCVASGDGGSSDARNKHGTAAPAQDGKAHVDWPGSNPYVLACGGTQLLSDKTEVVWNNSARGGGAGGGGVSMLYTRPVWQNTAGVNIPSANHGSMAGRVVPDVAGLAAGGDWLIALDGKNYGVGGTSAVAPMWASLITLANEKRATAHKTPVGFITERLSQYAHKKQESLFVDVVSGDNRPTPGYPGYSAMNGYDACTGWGVPRGEEICMYLAELP